MSYYMTVLRKSNFLKKKKSIKWLLLMIGFQCRILKKIEIDSPVTAVEFFPDGTSLVIGTNRGKILIYDLRSISTPVQSIIGHATSITKLICRACTHIQVYNITYWLIPLTSATTHLMNVVTLEKNWIRNSEIEKDFQTSNFF